MSKFRREVRKWQTILKVKNKVYFKNGWLTLFEYRIWNKSTKRESIFLREYYGKLNIRTGEINEKV